MAHNLLTSYTLLQYGESLRVLYWRFTVLLSDIVNNINIYVIAMLSVTLQRLHSRLEISSLSADQLICRFLTDLAEIQCRDDSAGSEEGDDSAALHFSYVYMEGTSTIEVCIFEAMNLSTLDRSGMYVQYVVNTTR